MPRKPKRPCSYPGCPNLTDGRFCPEHEKKEAKRYVAMSQNFMSQTNRLWMEIYQIVKENCATEYNGATPQDDVMERLLLARKGN